MDRSDHTVSRRSFLQTTGQAALAGALAASVSPGQSQPANSDRKIRMGIVGGGFGASFYWHEHPNCRVAAVSDLRPERREGLMKVYKCEKSYESLEELILDKEVDAVAVFTGGPDHVRHAVAAMEAGKHVISAVPAGMNLEECERLLEAKERTKRIYMMAETSYYRYHTIAVRDLFKAGRFGEMFYSEVEYYHPHPAKYLEGMWYRDGQPTWRNCIPPLLYPTHSTGFLVGVTGERFTHVSCLGWGNPEIPGLLDAKNDYKNTFSSMTSLMKTDKAHMCRCNVLWDGVSSGERAQWFGTKMTYYMPGSAGPLKVVGQNTGGLNEVPKFWERLPEPLRHESGHGGSHTFLTHEFVSALLEDREPTVNIYEALAMTVPGIVANESAKRGGEQLKIPRFDKKI